MLADASTEFLGRLGDALAGGDDYREDANDFDQVMAKIHADIARLVDAVREARAA